MGWLGILAGAAVFVAALAVPLDDPALLLALVLALRGGQMVLDMEPLVAHNPCPEKPLQEECHQHHLSRR